MFDSRILVATVGVLAAALALSGCSTPGSGLDGMDAGAGSTPSATSDSQGTFNDQDIAFASLMIPHHQQAVEMAQTLLDKDGVDSRVTDLATAIKAAQDPEIEQMKSWLDAWGAPYEHTSGMDMGMDGMMSDDDMAALGAVTGVEANTVFLEQMIVHHQGAIEMAKTELDGGENSDALTLAQNIIDSQAAEIDLMNEILATL